MALELNGVSVHPAASVTAPGDDTLGTKKGDAKLSLAQKDAPVKAVPRAPTPQDEDRLKEIAREFNDFVKHFGTELSFSVDSGSGQTVVKVLNKQTGELIRQIPSEEMLKASQALDTLRGLIIREKA